MKQFLITALLMAMGTHAQEMSPEHVINRLEKELKAAETLSIEFTETYHWKVTDEKASIDGTLLMIGEKKFRIETEDQILVSDGRTVWTYSKPDNRVLIDLLGDSETQMLPRRMLFHYTKDYDVQSVGKAVLDGVECVRLIFTSKTEATLYPRSEIWVNLKTWLPIQVLQEDLDGNDTIYRLHQIKSNLPLTDEEVGFRIPDGASVIDLRG